MPQNCSLSQTFMCILFMQKNKRVSLLTEILSRAEAICRAKDQGRRSYTLIDSVCCPPAQTSTSWLYTAFIKPSSRAQVQELRFRSKGGILYNSHRGVYFHFHITTSNPSKRRTLCEKNYYYCRCYYYD